MAFLAEFQFEQYVRHVGEEFADQDTELLRLLQNQFIIEPQSVIHVQSLPRWS